MSAPTPAELFGLDGKVAIVTGAASEVGARWTIVFLASDASSDVTDRHLLVDGGWSVS